MTTITAGTGLFDRTRSRSLVRPRVGVVLLAATFGIVWIVSLSRNIFDPIGYDQALWQYISEQVIAGQKMYVDIWEQNTPGIIVIHLLSTYLVGTEPMSLRIFDAGWQLLAMMGLVALAVRDRGRWHVGWLAATLYALAYYATGYVHTAQREGFTVLPLLLAVHAVAPAGRTTDRKPAPAIRHLSAGVLCFFVFSIKTPLGICFGTLWLLTLADAWRRRSEGRSAWTGFISLTSGFVLSAGAAVALLVRLGWWEGFWPVLTRQDLPEYPLGPELVRQILPYAMVGSLVIAIVAWLQQPRKKERGLADVAGQMWDWAHWVWVGLMILGLLVTLDRWAGWQRTFWPIAGVFLPAFGAVAIRAWRGRSRIWQLALLMAAASLMSIMLQGRYAMYHFPPFMAFAAYLAANEIVDRFRRFRKGDNTSRVWAMVCLACVAYLAGNSWWRTMTFFCDSPYVLANRTLSQHYTNVTKHKYSYPKWETTEQTAALVRELTAKTDPIACLVNEPRLYYLSRRPPVHPLLMTNPVLSAMYPDFIQTIRDKQPRVVLARLPQSALALDDLEAVHAAVFDAEEARIGPFVSKLRDLYEVTHVVDDLCILQPVESAIARKGHTSTRG